MVHASTRRHSARRLQVRPLSQGATELHANTFAARAGRWSAQHRKTAIWGWIAFVVVAFVIGGAVGVKKPTDYIGPGDSGRADRLALDHFPEDQSESVLIQAPQGGSAQSAAVRNAVDDTIAAVRGKDRVAEIKSPYAKGNESQIAKNGRSVLVTFKVRGDQDQADDAITPIVDAVHRVKAQNPGVFVGEFGGASADKALSKSFSDDFKKAEYLSLPITLVILIVAFGALVAAGIPLILALTAVFATLGLLGPISHLMPVDESIGSVVLLIGLAVGVDYTMFYLRREMEERDAGYSPEEALERAAATSGRAVLVSGFTVMIAMAGMFLAGNKVFTSFAVGTILVVAVAVLGSLTVLPALLSKLGDKVEKGRVPFIARRRHANHGENRLWGAVLDRVLKRPAVSVVLSAGLLVVLALPALNMHTANSGVQGLPRSLPIMQTYDRIQTAFPGGPIPLTVVVQADDVKAPAVQQGIAAMTKKALATGQMSEPVTTRVNPHHNLEIVNIPMVGDGTDKKSEAALATMRDEVVPATIGSVHGVETNVTGLTAGSKDFNDTMKSHLPLVFGFVLGLAFLLLLVTFRSIVVPIKAILLNLLSVGASYGVLTWIFQDGHLEGPLGFQSMGGITSWLPLFLFVVLFGLSMDYHVFIVSRIREAVDRGMRTDEAVSHGIKSTAGVVTSAAVVMIAVFAIFATLSALDFKMMGVGLAVAVLIDATIVRAVLLPATMKLLGDWNWYLPKRLDWLPRISHEGTAPESARA